MSPCSSEGLENTRSSLESSLSTIIEGSSGAGGEGCCVEGAGGEGCCVEGAGGEGCCVEGAGGEGSCCGLIECSSAVESSCGKDSSGVAVESSCADVDTFPSFFFLCFRRGRPRMAARGRKGAEIEALRLLDLEHVGEDWLRSSSMALAADSVVSWECLTTGGDDTGGLSLMSTSPPPLLPIPSGTVPLAPSWLKLLRISGSDMDLTSFLLCLLFL